MKLTEHLSAVSAEVKYELCYTSSRRYVFKACTIMFFQYYASCRREAGILFNWWNFSITCKITLVLFDTVYCTSEFSLNFGACGILTRIYWKMWMCIPVSLCNVSSRYWNLKSLSFPLLAGIKNGAPSIPYSLWVNNFLCSAHPQADAGFQVGGTGGMCRYRDCRS